MNAKICEVKQVMQQELRDGSKPWAKIFKLVELKTGVDAIHIFVGAVVFIAMYLVFGSGAELLCNGIAFVYPAYNSMNTLESPRECDNIKWLTYWVVYAVFSIVEYFANFIVGWLPLYWLIKCIFIVWCFLPLESNGSMVIYRCVIRPYYIKLQGSIEKVADNAHELSADAIRKNS